MASKVKTGLCLTSCVSRLIFSAADSVTSDADVVIVISLVIEGRGKLLSVSIDEGNHNEA